MVAWKKKSGRQSRRIEDLPHSYLGRKVTKGLWGVKRFLRPSSGSVSDCAAYQGYTPPKIGECDSDRCKNASGLKPLVEQDGFAVVPACLDQATLEHLSRHFDDTRHPQRNLLSVPSVHGLAVSKPVREIIETVLGPRCFAVRGIFFNKTRGANWKVVWHQDLTIALRERREVDGFGPWTTKAGIMHVQPPAEVMAGILAIRLHLDDSGLDNGPLRVVPGSHRQGRLSAEQMQVGRRRIL